MRTQPADQRFGDGGDGDAPREEMRAVVVACRTWRDMTTRDCLAVTACAAPIEIEIEVETEIEIEIE